MLTHPLVWAKRCATRSWMAANASGPFWYWPLLKLWERMGRVWQAPAAAGEAAGVKREAGRGTTPLPLEERRPLPLPWRKTEGQPLLQGRGLPFGQAPLPLLLLVAGRGGEGGSMERLPRRRHRHRWLQRPLGFLEAPPEQEEGEGEGEEVAGEGEQEGWEADRTRPPLGHAAKGSRNHASLPTDLKCMG